MYSDGDMMWRELNESILLEGTPLCEGRWIRVKGGRTKFGAVEQSEKKLKQ